MRAWALYEHLCGHCNLNLSRYCKVKLLLCVFSLWCGSRAGSWWPWPVIRIGSFMPTWHSSHPSLFSSSSSAGVFNHCIIYTYTYIIIIPKNLACLCHYHSFYSPMTIFIVIVFLTTIVIGREWFTLHWLAFESGNWCKDLWLCKHIWRS